MSGTHEGGVKAMQTNKDRYGDNFPKQIGRKGGKISRNGGFQVGSILAREAGRYGGTKSRRTEGNTISCPKCSGMFKTESTLNGHIQKLHREGSYSKEQQSWLNRVFGK